MDSDSVLDISLLAGERETIAPRAVEDEVLVLFDRCAPSLLRYVASFGLSAEDSEDVVQEVFLALFCHLRRERSRRNLKGWLFQVAHNQALKQRQRLQRRGAVPWDDSAPDHADPAPDPEARIVHRQRRQRLEPVIQALAPRDRQCLFLRAQGLRYRDIAQTLGISLGGVAKSLARTITRLVNADRG